MDKYYLDANDYKDMMYSEYVQKYINPRFPFEEEEALRLKKQLCDRSQFKAKNGIGYWISSDTPRVVPMHVAHFARFLGKHIVIRRHKMAYDQQTKEFLKEYAESQKNRVLSDEERFEMEAAFGKGTEVVDVLSGKRFRV